MRGVPDRPRRAGTRRGPAGLIGGVLLSWGWVVDPDDGVAQAAELGARMGAHRVSTVHCLPAWFQVRAWPGTVVLMMFTTAAV